MRKYLVSLFILFGLITSVNAYTVKRGDTLSQIALDNKVSLQTIIEQNPQIVNPNRIFPGQEITLLTLGATTPVAGTTYRLYGAGVTASATSIVLQSLSIPQTGKLLQDSDFSDTFYVTFEPGSQKRQEIASCTTVVQNANGTATLSGCTRGLLPFSEYTASSTYAFPHAGGTSLIFSDAPQLFNEYTAKNNNETVTGTWTFNAFPQASSTTALATSPSQFVTLYQLSISTTTGCSNASVSVRGCSQQATDSMLQSSSSTGSTGAATFANGSSFAQTSTANKVPVANGQGKIDAGYIPTSSSFTFTNTNSFTGTTTMATTTIVSSTINQLNLKNVDAYTYLHTLLYSNSVSSSLVNTTASSTYVSTTIPGNFFTTSSLIRITMAVSDFSIINGSDMAFNFSYGNNSIEHHILNNAGFNISGLRGTLTYNLIASTSTAAQRIQGAFEVTSSTIGVTTSTPTYILGSLSPNHFLTTFAKILPTDSTASQALKVDVRTPTSDPGNKITVDFITVELVRFRTPQ